MKYKRLRPEELQALEKEFVNFLASAQITAQDWEKMKEQELEKANELIEVFSDLVYDKVLRKIKFLEFRDAKTLNIFNCTEEKIKLLGLRVNESSTLDLTAPDVLSKWNQSNSGNVTVVRTEKNYSKERELEMFELLQTGCLITDDKLYNLLRGMV
ncbi:MAG: hypothetical protein A3F72_17315 [Bacteroidetes bacterium RIFCSPLOWO2_12_FULL_35_15]|nr:MAG: hypothetical protein A3F72_17315 [Bacteroidetes bacterium RIFCSPLOWO2_12_FULL_35_15]